MNMHDLSERLFKTLGHPNFLAMKGLANEVPIVRFVNLVRTTLQGSELTDVA